MIILGIDPGLAMTGWGVLQKAEPTTNDRGPAWKVLEYGSIKTVPGVDLSQRLDCIHQGIKKLLVQFAPDAVVVEQLFFGANAKTAMVVGEARGAVLLACGEQKITVAEYTPLQIKIALTNYGRAEKSQVQRMVQKFLGLKKIPRPNHAADALACAYCHAVTTRWQI